jgi:hypothetical protein
MFRLTKIKVAGLIVAGAVALGAVGAYAANTVPGPLTKAGTVNGQTLWALPSNSTTLQASFASFGDCVSWYASHKGFVLGGTQTQTVKKNYHGKLMSSISTLCTKTKDSTSTDTETQDSTQTETGADTGTPPAWAHHGRR